MSDKSLFHMAMNSGKFVSSTEDRNNVLVSNLKSTPFLDRITSTFHRFTLIQLIFKQEQVSCRSSDILEVAVVIFAKNKKYNCVSSV